MKNERNVLLHLLGALEMLYELRRRPGDPSVKTMMRVMDRLASCAKNGNAPGIVVRALANQRLHADKIGEEVADDVAEYRETHSQDLYGDPQPTE